MAELTAITIQADDNDDHSDVDSALGEDAVSSTASINSSIRNYRQEYGRTYHAFREGSYHYPNDDAEQERLDLQHHIWSLTCDGKLGLAPPNAEGADPKRVLDVGTGTGAWAIDFGDEHPKSQVIGIDLSPIQPAFVPPNVQFQVDDFEDEWTFSEKFDYIFLRALNGSVSTGRWTELLKKCYDNLNPGGWVELHEFGLFQSDDGTMAEGSAVAQASEIFSRGGDKLNHAFIHPWKARTYFEEAGFVSITQKDAHWPSNTWPKEKKLKEIGVWQNVNLSTGLEGLLVALACHGLGMEPTAVTVLAAQTRNQIKDKKNHIYNPVTMIYGQKPEK